ncbi:hypothetical protein ACS0TY_025615 [Phlomoides rotata]
MRVMEVARKMKMKKLRIVVRRVMMNMKKKDEEGDEEDDNQDDEGDDQDDEEDMVSDAEDDKHGEDFHDGSHGEERDDKSDDKGDEDKGQRVGSGFVYDALDDQIPMEAKDEFLQWVNQNCDSGTRVILSVENIPPPNAEWFNSIWNHDGWLRHLRENIMELQRNYDQLTLNVKVNGNVQQANLDAVQTSINGIRVQQVEPQQVFQVPEPGKTDSAYTSPFSKENVHQAEPSQGFQVLGSGKVNSTDTNSSSKLEETEHQASKPNVSGQPRIYGVKEGEVSLRPQKGHKLVDTNVTCVKLCWWLNNTWGNLLKGMEFRPEHFITYVSGKYPLLWALKGTNPIDVRRWYGFGALASICTVAPVYYSWHNNPHLKRDEELDIKFITIASEDMTNAI